MTLHKDELRQEITDICFENGGVSKPMVDKLEAYVAKKCREARIDDNQAWLELYKNAQDSATVGIKLEAIIKRFKSHIKQLKESR